MATETQPSGVTPVVGTDPVAALLQALLRRAPSQEEIDTYSKIWVIDPEIAKAEIQAYATEQKLAAEKQARLDPFSVTHLVKFVDDPTKETDTGTSTVWLFDAKDHELDGQYYAGTLIPFATEEGFNKFFAGTGMTLKDYEALNMINPVPTTALKDTESKFYNSRIVKGINGINSAGIMSPTESIRWRYGKDINESGEIKATELLKNVFAIVKKDDPTFTETYYNNAFNDPVNRAKYVNALAYGGYTVSDIYRDIVAHNRRVAGDANYAGYTGISPTQSKQAWVSVNPAYKTVTSGQTAINPPALPGMSASWKDLDMPIWLIPPQAYTLGIAPYKVDMQDPKTIEEINKTQDLMTDVAIQMANSDNQRDLDAAKYNWEQLKKETEESMGIKLEDNAYDAWNQLENLKTSTSDRGVLNTGIFNRGLDLIMRQRRLADARFRESSKTIEEDQQRTHLLNNASDEEIAAFIAKDPEKAKDWGLIPDDATLAFFNLENMKKLYPNETEETLQDIINISLGGTAAGGTPFFHSTIMRNHFANMRELKKANLAAKQEQWQTNTEAEWDKEKEQWDEEGQFSGTSELPADGSTAPGAPSAPGTGGVPGAAGSSTNKMPAGVLVRNSADGKVYFVDAKKQLRYVSDPSWIKGAHVQNVDPSHFNGVTYGAKITTQPIAADGKPMLFKGGAEAKSMFDKVGIDWTKPRGYNPASGAVVTAKPTTAVSPTTVTLPKVSSFTSMTEAPKVPNISPSDSRYWSVNPNNLLNTVAGSAKQTPAPTTQPAPVIPEGVSPSDSRYWSINPNNLLNK